MVVWDCISPIGKFPFATSLTTVLMQKWEMRFWTASFFVMFWHFPIRQCNTTSCTYYKCMAEEEEGMATQLISLQGWPVSSGKCVENFDMKNVTKGIPMLHTVRCVCKNKNNKITVDPILWHVWCLNIFKVLWEEMAMWLKKKNVVKAVHCFW